jgi:glycosyltransferase involved in cell wall biosynthesis
VDVAIVTTRMIGMDAISNFTMASAAALANNGKSTIFTFAYERPPVGGVDVRFLGGRNAHGIGTNLKALLNTRSLARELSKYDVLIMVNPDVGSMPACHLAKRYNPMLKAMWTFHGLTPTEFVSSLKDRWLMRIRKRAYLISMKRTELIKVDSDFVRRELVSWGIDPSKVVAMRLGTDLSRMAGGNGRRIRDLYGVGDRFLLLYVGRLMKFKGVDKLIQAVSRLEGICLLVVGGGPDLERLERLAGEPRVGDRVKIAGTVADSELPGYYAACDAWATASRHEGFCVPIIEAMAAGKPVIVPDVAAMPEVAGDGGLVYRPEDLDDLIKKVGLLKNDAGAFTELSGRARERAGAFDISTVIVDYSSLISDYWSNGLSNVKN